ncbi:MAG: ATP-binding protein [Leptospirales bacterium]
MKLPLKKTGFVIKFLDYFVPEQYLRVKNYDKVLRLRIAVASTLLIIFISLVTASLFIIHPEIGVLTLFLLFIPYNALTLYFIRKNIAVNFSNWMILISYTLMNATVMYFNGGLMVEGIPWILFIALQGTFLGGPRLGITMSVLNLSYLITFAFLEQRGYSFPHYLSNEAANLMAVLMTALLTSAVVLIAWLFNLSRNYAWGEQKKINKILYKEIKLRKSIEKVLNNANKELDALNKNLQTEIKDRMEKLRQNETYLTQQSKMAAMGEMVGAIAHQWRQPLTSISLIIQDLTEAYDGNEFDEQYLNDSVKKTMILVKQMSSTIDDFRNFLKPSNDEIKFNLFDALEETIKISLSMVRSNLIKISLQKIDQVDKPENMIISGYLNEFKQVILNLIMNSKDSIEERRLQNPLLQGIIKITLISSNNAVIKIKDNGGGIPDKIIDKIFHPYFTTKTMEKGTGIGLYMSKNIIEQRMKGLIFAFNEEDGAVITIVLPTTSA